MSAVTVDARGPMSIAEWEALPDDGNRYELIDGTLYVNAAPNMRHQSYVGELHLLLARNCPPHARVLVGPVDFQIGDATIVEPDLLVVPRSVPMLARLYVPPLLVVEVLSPSTRRYDRGEKLGAYDRGRVGACWLLDPDEPSLQVYERDGDRLVERARVAGEEAFAAEVPFAVTVVPALLVAE